MIVRWWYGVYNEIYIEEGSQLHMIVQESLTSDIRGVERCGNTVDKSGVLSDSVDAARISGALHGRTFVCA